MYREFFAVFGRSGWIGDQGFDYNPSISQISSGKQGQLQQSCHQSHTLNLNKAPLQQCCQVSPISKWTANPRPNFDRSQSPGERADPVTHVIPAFAEFHLTYILRLSSLFLIPHTSYTDTMKLLTKEEEDAHYRYASHLPKF